MWGHALITGGSRGIGRAMANELARSCASITLTARDAAALEEAVAEVERAGGRAKALVLDVGDTARTVAAIRELDASLDGGLDLVVANAGVGMIDPDMTPFSWEAIEGAFHVNFCGAGATLTAALPAMVARGKGHLVGIGSLASFGPLPAASAYCAAKAGLSMLLECLELDLAGTGVAVTTVNLGFVRTRMTARSKHPMPQLMDADVAASRIVKALASRPRTVTVPKALAALTWAASLAPMAWKTRVFPRLAK